MGDYRTELKYFISLEQAYQLRQKLPGIMRPDRSGDGQGRYVITSLYFDDDEGSYLRESDDGVNIRKKYRIRIYNHNDSIIKLEKKAKRNSLSRKTSCTISKGLYRDIINGYYDSLKSLNNTLTDELYYEITNSGIRPKTIVEYNRQAFTYRVSNVRITLDTNVKGSCSGLDLFSPYVLTPTLPSFAVILEVKYDNFLPDFISALLPRDAAPRLSVSKYVLGRTYI